MRILVIKDTYENQKTNVLLNARQFYKGWREIFIDFEENIFSLPKPYVFGKNEWKEKDIPGNEKYMPKTFKLSFLEKNYQTELSEKENKLLDRDFGYKNIDELMAAFDNTKTDEEFDELFDNYLNTLKKLVRIVPNKTEKERINNVTKSVEFILDQICIW